MSIDAHVWAVVQNPDGTGSLCLADRPPARPGENPGIAGQSSLHFDSAPPDVASLVGRDIWGGDGMIMLGERKIAERLGYTKIRFVVPDFKG